MMGCPRCAAPVYDGVFCGVCGLALSTSPSAPAGRPSRWRTYRVPVVLLLVLLVAVAIGWSGGTKEHSRVAQDLRERPVTGPLTTISELTRSWDMSGAEYAASADDVHSYTPSSGVGWAHLGNDEAPTWFVAQVGVGIEDGSYQSMLAGFDPDTGAVSWRLQELGDPARAFSGATCGTEQAGPILYCAADLPTGEFDDYDYPTYLSVVFGVDVRTGQVMSEFEYETPQQVIRTVGSDLLLVSPSYQESGVGGASRVLRMNPATGEIAWTISFDLNWTTFDGQQETWQGADVLGNDLLVLDDYAGGDVHTRVFDVLTGEPAFDLPGEPMIFGDHLFVVDGEELTDYGERDPSAATTTLVDGRGREVWTVQGVPLTVFDRVADTESPILFRTDDEHVGAVNIEDGKAEWELTFTGQNGVYLSAVTGDQVVVDTDTEHVIVGRDGREIGSGPGFLAATSATVAYLVTDSWLTAQDLATGKMLWSQSWTRLLPDSGEQSYFAIKAAAGRMFLLSEEGIADFRAG